MRSASLSSSPAFTTTQAFTASPQVASGDLTKGAYQQLTAAGFHDPVIVASNDLDEDIIADLELGFAAAAAVREKAEAADDAGVAADTVTAA